MKTLEELLTPHDCKFWGTDYHVIPVLLEKQFGDGGKFLLVYPINERPSYWVVRIDSDCTDAWEIIDAIYDAIDEEFGEPRQDEDERPYFPMYDGEGTAWEFV